MTQDHRPLIAAVGAVIFAQQAASASGDRLVQAYFAACFAVSAGLAGWYAYRRRGSR